MTPDYSKTALDLSRFKWRGDYPTPEPDPNGSLVLVGLKNRIEAALRAAYERGARDMELKFHQEVIGDPSSQ